MGRRIYKIYNCIALWSLVGYKGEALGWEKSTIVLQELYHYHEWVYAPVKLLVTKPDFLEFSGGQDIIGLSLVFMSCNCV